jgi:tetratricopeptide (TPR) repeat protein
MSSIKETRGGSMAFDAFISYSSFDKVTADTVCNRLESAGIRCWIAPRDIAPGATWTASIVRAITQCRVMVLVFSSNANGSDQVHREVDLAFSKNIPVLPFRIENAAWGDELAYHLNRVHWLDAVTPPLEKHLQGLAESVKALLTHDKVRQGEKESDVRPALEANERGVVALRDDRDLDRAIAEFDEAIRLDPKCAAAFSNRATAYSLKGEHRRAIQDFDEAIRLDPTHPTHFKNRASAYADLKQYKQAIEDLDEAIRLKPTAFLALTFLQRAQAKRAIGDNLGAEADFKQAEIVDPVLGKRR